MENQKNVLMKCVYGSKLYGTDGPNSDTDYKTVFLPDFKDVLLGRQLRTKVRTTGTDETKNTKDDVDEQFVPLQTFAREFFEGQTYALELAMFVTHNPYAVPAFGLEHLDTKFKLFVQLLVKQFMHRDVKAMVGYAWNQAQKYQLKGRRFNALETLKDYLATWRSKNPTATKVGAFLSTAVLDGFFETNKYFGEDCVLVNNNTLPAMRVMDKLVLSTVKLEELENTVNTLLKQYGHRSKAAVDADVDWKSLYHALRVAFQARDLLRDGYFNVPYSEDRRKLLLAVKNGEMQMDYVADMLSDVVDELDAVRLHSPLQEKTDELRNEFEDFLFDWLVNFYKLDASFLT